jgi:L-threonylcarbamoyladenylate synthase
MTEPEDIARAVALLRAGRLVAFPTETVYGLGADASQPDAIARLYRVKGREATHPVIVHGDSAEAAFGWAAGVPAAAKRLAERFWPGPLTLVLKRAARAGHYLTGGQDSIGLRVPSHPVALALLAAFREATAGGGGPSGIAAPSANRSGRISPTTALHVRIELGDDVDCVLEGGASEVGIESTIVDLSRGRVVVLRPGHVSVEALAEALGEPVVVAGAEPGDAPGDTPRAPGSHTRHYAPRTPARLVAPHALDAEIARYGARAAVLAFSRPDERSDYWLRMPAGPQDYARKLYGALRELDEAGCEVILIESPPEGAQWVAVRDRLRRASAEA